MEKLIITTKNRGKAREFRTLFSEFNYEIVTLNDLNNVPEIVENGNSFSENATIKAQAIYNLTHETVIADDSGLVVDELNGEPGIFSARYAGDHDDKANLEKLIKKISVIPPNKRNAHFITSLVAVGKYGRIEKNGTVDGIILTKPRGTNGFGYDPIFYYPPLKKTFAEMDENEKNQVSHRGRALRKLFMVWSDYVKDEK